MQGIRPVCVRAVAPARLGYRCAELAIWCFRLKGGETVTIPPEICRRPSLAGRAEFRWGINLSSPLKVGSKWEG